MADHDGLAAYEPERADAASAFADEPAQPKLALVSVISANLRRLRARQRLSLEKLAAISGVSRGMIGQIETGKSTPTVGLLARLAEALDVELPSLLAAEQTPSTKVMRRSRARTVQGSDGKYVARALSRADVTGVEFFEVVLARGHFEQMERGPAGAWAHIAVAVGIVMVTIPGEDTVTLAAGDAMLFAADALHGLHNLGDEEAVVYMVLSSLGPHG